MLSKVRSVSSPLPHLLLKLLGGIEGKEDTEFRIIYAIEDNKVAWGTVVEDNFFSAMKARCSSGFRTYNVINEYPTNM